MSDLVTLFLRAADELSRNVLVLPTNDEFKIALRPSIPVYSSQVYRYCSKIEPDSIDVFPTESFGSPTPL